MRQPLSDFWLRQQDDFAQSSRALFLLCFVLFYVIFNDHFTPSTFVSYFAMFFTILISVHFGSAAPHFSDVFFFHPSLLLVAARTRFLCGDRGRSLFRVPRGGLSLGLPDPRFSHSRPSLRFHRFRPGSFPHLSARLRFRCRSTRSRSSHTVPTSH